MFLVMTKILVSIASG